MEKRKPGRPKGTTRGKGIRVAIALKKESWEWLKKQDEMPAKVIERLIKNEIGCQR